MAGEMKNNRAFRKVPEMSCLYHSATIGERDLWVLLVFGSAVGIDSTISRVKLYRVLVAELATNMLFSLQPLPSYNPQSPAVGNNTI
jgi:hypothetical protein